MGTRGTWGFIHDGEQKLTYNHFDSYPTGLGNALVTALRGRDLEELTRQVDALKVIPEDAPRPTEDELTRYGDFRDSGVSGGADWYALLRHTQGDLDLTLAAGAIIDGSTFPADSLFCEWVYVINLDEGMLEVFEGFQDKPHQKGRFADMPREEDLSEGGTYYPVAMVAAYSLRELPENLNALEVSA